MPGMPPLGGIALLADAQRIMYYRMSLYSRSKSSIYRSRVRPT